MTEKVEQQKFYIIKYLKPYRTMLLGVLLALLITSSSVLVMGKGLQFFIDGGLVTNNVGNLNKAVLYLVVIALVLAVATYARFFLITWVGEKIITDVNRDIYHHILKLSPSFYEAHKAGDILSRLTSDTTLLLTIIGSSLSVAMRNIVMLIGGIVMLVSSSLKLTIVIFAVIPLVVFPILKFRKKLRDYAKAVQDKIGEIISISEETIYSIKTIFAYNREKSAYNHFKKVTDEALAINFLRIKTRSALTAIVISLVFSGVTFMLWVGGISVIEGNLTAGELSAFVFTSIVCAGAVAALSDVTGDMQKAIGATYRIVEFLAEKPDVTDKPTSINIPNNHPISIEFKDVLFNYPSRLSKAALEGVSFEIEEGKVTAIVGESGAGKSTIFQLLERFYDIDKGQILFGNTDITNIKISSLRSKFALVAQDPVIFSDTIYYNIAYGKEKATKREVEEAAKKAEILEFAKKLPEGLHTYIGEKGIRLSGGQKQRIAIARALLNNPKLLLLDEATSSLDTRNEKLVQSAIAKLMTGRTTIVIAHRLSTVVNADKIIVLDEGKVIECGTHKELLSKKGKYSELVALQLRD